MRLVRCCTQQALKSTRRGRKVPISPSEPLASFQLHRSRNQEVPGRGIRTRCYPITADQQRMLRLCGITCDAALDPARAVHSRLCDRSLLSRNCEAGGPKKP